MELIRLLLLQEEQGEAPAELGNYSATDQIYNLQLMADASLIEAHFTHGSGGEVVHARTVRLTWAGHDFLDATRDSKIWKLAKEQVLKPGASWTFNLLLEWLKQKAREHVLGMPSSGE